MKNFNDTDTICALATGSGISAIALIRVSGNDSIKITNKISIIIGNPNEAKAKNNVRLNKIFNMELDKVIFTIYFIYVN